MGRETSVWIHKFCQLLCLRLGVEKNSVELQFNIDFDGPCISIHDIMAGGGLCLEHLRILKAGKFVIHQGNVQAIENMEKPLFLGGRSAALYLTGSLQCSPNL